MFIYDQIIRGWVTLASLNILGPFRSISWDTSSPDIHLDCRNSGCCTSDGTAVGSLGPLVIPRDPFLEWFQPTIGCRIFGTCGTFPKWCLVENYYFRTWWMTCFYRSLNRKRLSVGLQRLFIVYMHAQMRSKRFCSDENANLHSLLSRLHSQFNPSQTEQNILVPCLRRAHPAGWESIFRLIFYTFAYATRFTAF